jgi:hypothetical protein
MRLHQQLGDEREPASQSVPRSYPGHLPAVLRAVLKPESTGFVHDLWPSLARITLRGLVGVVLRHLGLRDIEPKPVIRGVVLQVLLQCAHYAGKLPPKPR